MTSFFGNLKQSLNRSAEKLQNSIEDARFSPQKVEEARNQLDARHKYRKYDRIVEQHEVLPESSTSDVMLRAYCDMREEVDPVLMQKDRMDGKCKELAEDRKHDSKVVNNLRNPLLRFENRKDVLDAILKKERPVEFFRKVQELPQRLVDLLQSSNTVDVEVVNIIQTFSKDLDKLFELSPAFLEIILKRAPVADLLHQLGPKLVTQLKNVDSKVVAFIKADKEAVKDVRQLSQPQLESLKSVRRPDIVLPFATESKSKVQGSIEYRRELLNTGIKYDDPDEKSDLIQWDKEMARDEFNNKHRKPALVSSSSSSVSFVESSPLPSPSPLSVSTIEASETTPAAPAANLPGAEASAADQPINQGGQSGGRMTVFRVPPRPSRKLYYPRKSGKASGKASGKSGKASRKSGKASRKAGKSGKSGKSGKASRKSGSASRARR